MKITKQARRGARELLQTCLPAGVLDEARVRLAVQEVLNRKPRGYKAVLSHFHRLVRLELHRRSARVESATPLDAAQQAQLQSQLARTYGPGLAIAFSVEPGLIGGLRVQVGSNVLDGSIQSRLLSLTENA